METITSTRNPRVAEAKKLRQKKYREEKNLFLAEGLRLCEEAAQRGQVEEVYYHESLTTTQRGADVLAVLSLKTKRFFQVTAQVMDAIAETDTPQGILCVCRRSTVSLLAFDPDPGIVLLTDSIQDPGNLGSIMRTLWAAGGGGLICLKGSADPFNGKCVRASMGGIFALPVITDADWSDVSHWMSARGFRLVAADASGGTDYRHLTWPQRTLLCIGNEAAGLISIPPHAVDEQVYIPLAGEAESLNAGVAAGILIFDAYRKTGSVY